MKDRIPTYEAFWPFYMSQHSKRWTRLTHVFGTTVALLVVSFSLSTMQWGGIPIALVIGYGCAWFSHFFIEKNQ